MKIFEDDLIYIEIEPSEIPWLKIFSVTPYKEFSEAPQPLKVRIWEVLDIVESEMLSFFNPDKINIASFGNYLPHLHFHVMARFCNDSFFPEPMWGKKQREGTYRLENFPEFIEQLRKKL